MPLTTADLTPGRPPRYTVTISAEVAAEYADWTRVPGCFEAKIETYDDGTAEVFLRMVDDRTVDDQERAP